MHHAFTSTSLRQLIDLGRQSEPSPWSWAIVQPDQAGRIHLPAAAKQTLRVGQGRPDELRGICHRDALVVEATGPGARFSIDRRGRLTLPALLSGSGIGMLVGTDRDAARLVITTITVLDRLGDLLARRVR